VASGGEVYLADPGIRDEPDPVPATAPGRS
jgi:hypothetical protein